MTVDRVTAELLAKGPFARDDAPYALVRVEGRDVGDFLQRLCSQDVLGLAPGALAPVAFLDAKGKVVVTAHALRAADAFVLELQQEQQERLLALLDRYHFAERLAFAAVAGTRCREVVRAAADGEQGAATVGDSGYALRCVRRGIGFLRTHGAAPPAGGEAALDDATAECLRMAAGYVRVGVETEAGTLALEADLDDHCSTTKGCYTGQEIVARIHTYGHTNRKLCFLHLGAGAAVTAPAPLLEPDDGVPVGRVMHAVPVPGHALRFGLGYLPPDFQAPGTSLRLEDGGPATVVW